MQKKKKESKGHLAQIVRRKNSTKIKKNHIDFFVLDII